MMKLLTPVLTIAKPFSQPSSAAERQRPRPWRAAPAARASCISQPLAITAQTPIAPTARFMPPVASTTICEKPMTMSTASDRPSEKRLNDDRNPGASEAKTTQKHGDDDEEPDLRRGAGRAPSRRRAGAWLADTHLV